MLRRLGFVAGTATMAVLLSAAPAFAFECYNASRSAKGNEKAAQSQALLSFEEILAHPEIVGLCPAGVEHVIGGVEEAGFRTDVLINFNALMAGGLGGKEHGETLLHDGRGIDHLGEAFFAVAEPLIGEGFGICFGGA